MTVVMRSIEIETPARPSFHDLTVDVARLVAESSITQGIAVVSSPHTTCSVIIQEESHDTDYYGTEYLMQDLMNVLESLVPTCRTQGQYLHPGPAHIAAATDERGEEPWWSLNVDAHLRSALLGRSESVPIDDRRLQLGEYGHIFFADLDQVRARRRTASVVLMGD
jgi:thiamine phosphate synthase YjbQ (UPF0047 family)